MSFTEQIRQAFHFLFEEFGFSFRDDEDVGDALVAQAGDIRLRFIRDRSDFFLDAGKSSTPDRWIGVYDILDNLRRSGQISIEFKYVNKMKPLGNLLKKTFPSVKEFLLARP